MSLKKLITEFNQTGPCKIDVTKTVKAWNDKFYITQYHEDYRLIKGRKENCARITISKEQAQELIEKLNLFPIQDSFFRFVITHRAAVDILADKVRLQKTVAEKEKEVEILYDVLRTYENALKRQVI